MKKTIFLLFFIGIIALFIYKMDYITDYIANYLDDEKKVYISSSNAYKKDYDFKFVKMSNTYVPYSYQALLNIIFSTLNNGWDTFTFYCPDEYVDCIKDVNKISNDSVLLSNINNFVNPYNSFSKIEIITTNTGEVTINVHKLYSDDEINKINIGVDEIITNQISSDMALEDKILKVHDYIINNTRYDVNRTNDASFTAMGPLFNGTAVCSGYADLMAIFLTRFGVKNFKVSSSTHVWNAVYINNTWLNLDLTWDDPVTKDGTVDTLLHQFFLINKDKLLEFDTKDHTYDATVFQEL